MVSMKLDTLERYVQQLLALLAHLKADNHRLMQSAAELQQARQEQQRLLGSWEAAQTELHDLRMLTSTLQHEREIIRAKLEALLATVEHLEAMSSAVEKS